MLPVVGKTGKSGASKDSNTKTVIKKKKITTVTKPVRYSLKVMEIVYLSRNLQYMPTVLILDFQHGHTIDNIMMDNAFLVNQFEAFEIRPEHKVHQVLVRVTSDPDDECCGNVIRYLGQAPNRMAHDAVMQACTMLGFTV